MTRLPKVGSDNNTWGTILNDFLSVAHNSDGSLSSSAVTQAGGLTQSSADSRYLQSSALAKTLNNQGTWQANTNYQQNDLVTYNGGAYVANTDFTSGSSFDSSNWTELSPSNDAYVGRAEGTTTTSATLPFVNILDSGADPTGTQDSSVAITAAISAASLSAHIVYVPAGTYLVANAISSSYNDLMIRGPGSGEDPQETAAVFRASQPITGAILTIAGVRNHIYGIGFDGNNLAATGLSVGSNAYDCHIEVCGAVDCTTTGFSSKANRLTSKNNNWRGATGGTAAAAIAGADNMIYGDKYTSNGSTTALLWSGGGLVVSVHCLGSDATATSTLTVQGSQALFLGCEFDTCINGPLVTVGTGATSTCTTNRFVGCYFYNPSVTNNSYPAILLDGSIVNVKDVKVSGGSFYSAYTNQFSYAVQQLGSVFSVSFIDNEVKWATQLWNVRPTTSRSNISVTSSSGNSAYVTELAGSSTFSGNGTTTTFSTSTLNLAVTSGLSPRSVVVTPGSAAAAEPFYAAYNTGTSKIDVTYLAAPASGTNNIILNWYIEL